LIKFTRNKYKTQTTAKPWLNILMLNTENASTSPLPKPDFEAVVPLLPSFRFAHEPVRSEQAQRFVGRGAELETLVERILFSEGGSFLVTGYRGVGKTSFVNQVVRRLRESVLWAASLLGDIEVLDVQLNLARPLEPKELMHHVIRRLYEGLLEKGLYSRLSAALREELLVAYQRTSFNMVRKVGETAEKSIGLGEASLGAEKLKAALKTSFLYKKSRSQNLEMTFMGYDDKAAEFDLIRLARRLTAGYEEELTWLERQIKKLRRVPPVRRRLKIVFVFDELDKLEEFTAVSNGKAKPFIDEMLGVLKNLFTTSGISFIFVAGKDLQERWLEDLGRGDSVYESVFCYDKYLACLWAGADEICDGFVDWDKLKREAKQSETSADSSATATLSRENGAPLVYEDFKKYLAYKGRGIPRRIIRGFNEHVQWSGKRPELAFTRPDARRMRFYAGLQDLLGRNERRLFGKITEEILNTQRDKSRLGVYYLLDWILRRGEFEFTMTDLLGASQQLSAKIAPTQDVAPEMIRALLDILSEGEYLAAAGNAQDQVQIGDVGAQKEPRYKLTPRRLAELRGLAEAFEAEAAAFKSEPTSAQKIGPYKIIASVGKGGMGEVFRAWDERNNRFVAVKVMAANLASDPLAAARFKREAQVLSALQHPGIARYYELGEDQSLPYLAMELLEGLNLGDLLARRGKFAGEVAAAIAKAAAEILRYVHGKGIVRNDVKPGNILLSHTGRIYLMDFGIAREALPSEQELTSTGVIVGTPFYMSPEQAQGKTVDSRSDIYALGVVLYEMITGQRPFAGESAVETIMAHLQKSATPPSQLVALSPELETLILKCLEKEPAQRFQTMAELAQALTLAPESSVMVDLRNFAAESAQELQTAKALEREATQVGPTMPAPATTATEVIASEMPHAEEKPAAPKPVASPLPPPQPVAPMPPPPSPQPQAETQFASSLSASESTPAWSGAHLKMKRAPQIERGKMRLRGETASPKDLRFGLVQGKLSLGRDNENDVRLEDHMVSKFHARVYEEAGRFYIDDLNTANGTWVNGKKIREHHALRPGDKIQIGESVMEFGV
jgi:serine/threonine-protein kinase